jgi:16S rRNA (guanine527-N7)-methyltransferase
MHPYFDLIPNYFPELSQRQLHRFEQLWDFYHHWNAKINVISRKDIDELYLRHVLHSLAIARIFKFMDGINVLDVGTGGGFPGIPLSIYFENVHFTLVDSIGKKIRVVNEAIKALNLQNAEGIQIRAEEIKQSFDVVVSRAVTDLPTFMSWVSNKIIKGNSSGVGNGIIYLKGGELTEELHQIKWPAKIHDISSIFVEDFFETKKVVHLVKP